MNEICMDKNFKIVVVGGGLTGTLMVQLLLKEKIVEKKDLCWINPTEKKNNDDRVSFINIKNFKSIEKTLNIKFSSNYYSLIKKIEIYNYDQKRPLSIKDTDNHGVIINNQKLKSILALNIDDLTEFKSIITNTELNKFGRSLNLKNGFKINAEIVLAADGNFSLLRKLLKINFFEKKLSHSIVSGYIRCSDSDFHTAKQIFLRNNFIGLLPTPLNDGILNFVWSLETDILQKHKNNTEITNSILDILNSYFKSYRIKFYKIKQNDFASLSKLDIYPCNVKFVPNPYGERIALIGDAAHSIHPLAGQGLNLSIEDCFAIVNCLKNAKLVGKNFGENNVMLEYNNKQKNRKNFITFATTSLYYLFKQDNIPLNKIINFSLEKLEKTRIKNIFKFLARGY